MHLGLSLALTRGGLLAPSARAVADSVISALTPAAWYRNATGVTSAGGFASKWDDYSGNTRHFVQSTGTNQPAYSAGVFTFDGADNFMATSATTINQPLSMYLVVKQISWTLNDICVDGGSNYQVYIFQNAATPAIRAGAGSDITQNTNLAVGNYGIVCAVINGATSSMRVNDTAKVTGGAGAGNFSAIRLGAGGSGTGASANIAVQEFVIFGAAHDDTTQSSVITALNDVFTVF